MSLLCWKGRTLNQHPCSTPPDVARIRCCTCGSNRVFWFLARNNPETDDWIKTYRQVGTPQSEDDESFLFFQAFAGNTPVRKKLSTKDLSPSDRELFLTTMSTKQGGKKKHKVPVVPPPDFSRAQTGSPSATRTRSHGSTRGRAGPRRRSTVTVRDFSPARDPGKSPSTQLDEYEKELEHCNLDERKCCDLEEQEQEHQEPEEQELEAELDPLSPLTSLTGTPASQARHRLATNSLAVTPASQTRHCSVTMTPSPASPKPSLSLMSDRIPAATNPAIESIQETMQLVPSPTTLPHIGIDVGIDVDDGRGDDLQDGADFRLANKVALIYTWIDNNEPSGVFCPRLLDNLEVAWEAIPLTKQQDSAFLAALADLVEAVGDYSAFSPVTLVLLQHLLKGKEQAIVQDKLGANMDVAVTDWIQTSELSGALHPNLLLDWGIAHQPIPAAKKEDPEFLAALSLLARRIQFSRMSVAALRLVNVLAGEELTEALEELEAANDLGEDDEPDLTIIEPTRRKVQDTGSKPKIRRHRDFLVEWKDLNDEDFYQFVSFPTSRVQAIDLPPAIRDLQHQYGSSASLEVKVLLDSDICWWPFEEFELEKPMQSVSLRFVNASPCPWNHADAPPPPRIRSLSRALAAQRAQCRVSRPVVKFKSEVSTQPVASSSSLKATTSTQPMSAFGAKPFVAAGRFKANSSMQPGTRGSKLFSIKLFAQKCNAHTLLPVALEPQLHLLLIRISFHVHATGKCQPSWTLVEDSFQHIDALTDSIEKEEDKEHLRKEAYWRDRTPPVANRKTFLGLIRGIGINPTTCPRPTPIESTRLPSKCVSLGCSAHFWCNNKTWRCDTAMEEVPGMLAWDNLAWKVTNEVRLYSAKIEYLLAWDGDGRKVLDPVWLPFDKGYKLPLPPLVASVYLRIVCGPQSADFYVNIRDRTLADAAQSLNKREPNRILDAMEAGYNAKGEVDPSVIDMMEDKSSGAEEDHHNNDKGRTSDASSVIIITDTEDDDSGMADVSETAHSQAHSAYPLGAVFLD
ncbi:hypothetical protein BKA62DRAFT_771551 [Auriculariales sp. MPI-PUGE-AT-0066]|nr:hypothetical protein BKA62DRAFT_771551 [Auriculariales sp. MPI-PUGE-AT-0066]